MRSLVIIISRGVQPDRAVQMALGAVDRRKVLPHWPGKYVFFALEIANLYTTLHPRKFGRLPPSPSCRDRHRRRFPVRIRRRPELVDGVAVMPPIGPVRVRELRDAPRAPVHGIHLLYPAGGNSTYVVSRDLGHCR